MPPKVKITKKMVEEASFEVIRARGHENLNARTIAEYLKCSTQPVLYSFNTVDEIGKQHTSLRMIIIHHLSCLKRTIKIQCLFSD